MSWDTVLLITAATVKTDTAFAQGVEDAKLKPAIFDAQDALQEVLGETLYAMVEAADPVADPTLGGDTGLQTLYDEHIRKYLGHKTKELAYPELWAGADRNGVFQRNGNDYNTVDGRGLAILQAVPRSRAEKRVGKMLHYLKNLDSTDPIRIAYETSVDSEPRTTEVKNTGRIITRRSVWQGNDNTYRHDDGR